MIKTISISIFIGLIAALSGRNALSTSNKEPSKNRNRAPLSVAQVDPVKLNMIRVTEQVLMPERGVMLGNFGASSITKNESWVTDAEYMVGDKPHPRGANGTVWAARVIWSKKNKLVK